LLANGRYPGEDIRGAIAFTVGSRVIVIATRVFLFRRAVRGVETADVAVVMMGHGGLE
jgi:hypothetical protein